MVDIVGITSEEIKNQSLALLGFVDELDFDSTTDATVLKVNRMYDNILLDALSCYRWRFAIKRANLTTTQATADDTWKYKYTYETPDDMLSFNACYTDAYYNCPIRYFETTQEYINTDEATVYIMYTALVAETVFPQYFISWFKYKLALDLCFLLTGDTNLQQILAEQERKAKISAKNTDARQANVRTIKASPFTVIRS